MPPLPRRGGHPRPSAVGTLVYLVLGPIIWAAQLTVIYGGTTLICVTGPPPAVPAALVAGTTAITLLATAGALRFGPRVAPWFGVNPEVAGRSTLYTIARFLDLLSLVAIVWTGSGVAFLEACIVAR